LKLNCLILAHKNVHQIARLIKRLEHPNVTIFIHLDSKWDVSTQEIHTLELSGTQVHILDKRISTRLDDWSLVEAAIELASFAQSQSAESSYFLLMSGQDYPIRPIEELLHLLESSYPKPFIDCTPYDDSNWVWHKFNHTSFSRLQFHLRNKIVRGLIRRFIRIFERYIPKSMLMINRLSHYQLSLYGGSAWWCLPDIAIRDILTDMGNSHDIIQLYKKTWTPEETFFQTFVMRSTVGHLVKVNPIDQVSQNCLTFASFTTPTKRFVGHPHVLENSDYEWLMRIRPYICRKFDTSIDSEILDRIDQQ